MFDFDTPLSRAGTHSVKYDLRRQRFGREDVLPLWVADMDFAAPDCVREALLARANHPVYGYTLAGEEVYAAIMDWQWRRHGWRVEREWITLLPGVVPGLALAVQAYTRPGESVVVQPPVYYPFYDVVERNGRRLRRNPLIWADGRHAMDLDQLADALTPDARLLLLSSPHNPGGRVWTRAELEGLGEACLRRGIIVIADEIHADIVYPGARHLPLAGLSPELAACTVTLNSPGKSFNIPGLGIAYAITPGAGLRRRLQDTARALHLEGANLMGLAALEAAYTRGGDWLAALLDYLGGNLDLAREGLARHLPDVSCTSPEATYLLWPDCRGLGLDDEALRQGFVDAGLGLSPGVQFGREGSGFMRMNVALPRARLREALDGLAGAFP